MQQPESSMSQNRSKRDQFRKQIRKSALDSKINYLRKTLIIEPNLCCSQLNLIVSNLLKAFDKFEQASISKCDHLHMKKFGKKLDSAVIVLAHIQKLILDDNSSETLLFLMDKLSVKQPSAPNQSKITQFQQNSHTFSLEDVQNLKQIAWEPEEKLSRLQTLQQMWKITLLIKIEFFLQNYVQILSSANYCSKIQLSHVIPKGVIKWLCFNESNLKEIMHPSQKQMRGSINSTHTYDSSVNLRNFYYEIASLMVSFLTLEQLNEIFFNSIYEIDMMKEVIDQKDFQGGLELEQSYIDGSPYEFFKSCCCEESQGILFQVRRRMEKMIQEGEKFIRIEELKLEEKQEHEYWEVEGFLRNQRQVIERGEELLKMMGKYLESKKIREVEMCEEEIDTNQECSKENQREFQEYESMQI